VSLKKWIRELPIYGKFGRDVSWNVLSLGCLGVVGIILTLVIGKVYGAATLGVFNQVYAAYILLSQFAVGGIHLSVLKHVSESPQNKQQMRPVIFSALILAAVNAAVICSIGFFSLDTIGRLFDSPAVAQGLYFVLPGLWCFALNKTLLAALNASRQMKAYAFSQAFRYIAMLVLLVACVMKGLPGYVLPVIFTGAEILLLVGLIVYTRGLIWPASFRQVFAWTGKHFMFGLKGFGSAVLSEVNTRVDVLMLGLFLSDRIVGLYSFAAVLVEGLLQLMVVVRTNVNPVLSSLFAAGRVEELKKTIERGVKIFYPVIAFLGIVLIVGFPLLVYIFLPQSPFMAAWPVFGVLMAGMMLSAGYFPFNMLLVQTGFPGYHTVLRAGVVFINIILNVALIPLWGMAGAAVATSLAFISGVFFLKLLVRRTVGIRI